MDRPPSLPPSSATMEPMSLVTKKKFRKKIASGELLLSRMKRLAGHRHRQRGSAHGDQDTNDYAESMKELLEWYDLCKTDSTEPPPQALDLKRYHTTMGTSSGASSTSPPPPWLNRSRKSRTSSDGPPTALPCPTTASTSGGGLAVATDDEDEVTSGSSGSPVATQALSAVVDTDHNHREAKKEDFGESRAIASTLCDWCQKAGKQQVLPLDTANGGSKAFCSEHCFLQCRRANFKNFKNKVCDWCKHTRHTVNYVDFQDGEVNLQFCSNKCLNQYKMNIFYREAEASLQMDGRQRFRADVEGQGPRMPTDSKAKLITPDLWLQDTSNLTSSSSLGGTDDEPDLDVGDHFVSMRKRKFSSDGGEDSLDIVLTGPKTIASHEVPATPKNIGSGADVVTKNPTSKDSTAAMRKHRRYRHSSHHSSHQKSHKRHKSDNGQNAQVGHAKSVLRTPNREAVIDSNKHRTVPRTSSSSCPISPPPTTRPQITIHQKFAATPLPQLQPHEPTAASVTSSPSCMLPTRLPFSNVGGALQQPPHHHQHRLASGEHFRPPGIHYRNPFVSLNTTGARVPLPPPLRLSGNPDMTREMFEVIQRGLMAWDEGTNSRNDRGPKQIAPPPMHFPFPGHLPASLRPLLQPPPGHLGPSGAPQHGHFPQTPVRHMAPLPSFIPPATLFSPYPVFVPVPIPVPIPFPLLINNGNRSSSPNRPISAPSANGCSGSAVRDDDRESGNLAAKDNRCNESR